MIDPLDTSRFDLEDALGACWGTKEDLELLYEEALEGDLSKEEIANALLGLIRLHDMRVARAFRIFEKLIRGGSIS